MISIVFAGHVFLFSEYIDLGNNSLRIKTTGITEIPNTSKFICFSPDGELVAFSGRNRESIIFNKDCTESYIFKDRVITWINDINKVIAYEWMGGNGL